MGEPLQTPLAELPDFELVLCPHCGYDLRGSIAEQCSECGHPINRATLGVSHFPWAHRRGIRAYCKTVWLITINSRRLKFEFSKNQSLLDARAFQRITTFLLVLTLTGSCAALLAADRHLFLVPRPGPRPANWPDDLIVPWAAGANFFPVIPMMFLLLALHLNSVHHRLFRLKSAPARIQERASAIACYATAPLALLFPLAMLWWIIFILLINDLIPAGTPPIWFALIPVFLGILLFPLTLLRILQWTLSVRNRGAEYSLLIAPQLLGLWLFGFVFYLGFLPWCIGLIWVAIDSFR